MDKSDNVYLVEVVINYLGFDGIKSTITGHKHID